jgi:Fic family protein
MGKQLKILTHTYFEAYAALVSESVFENIAGRKEPKLLLDDFVRFASVASVVSSQIEGSTIDVNTYFRNKTVKYGNTHDLKAIDDLVQAYTLAKDLKINKRNLHKIHATLSQSFINKVHRGKYRKSQMFIVNDKTGAITYTAAAFDTVETEMDKLLADIANLCASNLSTLEIFYYAALIHFRFLKIHPYIDGNGRTARLLEKWFLMQHLGEVAFTIPAEHYYHEHKQDYYKNLSCMGDYYEDLNWDKCMPFLLMLPASLG